MYKNHNEIITVVQDKATLRGPPNSALPKAVTYRLAIIIAKPVRDTAVQMPTLKPKVPAETLKLSPYN